MSTLKLNQQKKQLEISAFEISNEIVFNYFDRLPAGERDEKLLRALYIGVLALMEDRLSAFFAKTSNELGTQLESLKLIFEMKKEIFYKSAVKGMLAEDDIVSYLNDYFSSKGLKDKAIATGNSAGTIERNKTGDILCELDGKADLKVVIECKFDKSLKLGDIQNKDIMTKKSDTAWSQLIESQANRDAKVGIIVFDESLVDNSILRFCENVGFIGGVGFIAIINSQKGDYSNLAIAYMLARDLALNAKTVELDKDLLVILMTRIIKDINDVMSIRTLVMENIKNNQDILKQLDKSLLCMEFNQLFLMKFLETGTLSKSDLLEFYSGESIKEKFKSIEKQILDL